MSVQQALRAFSAQIEQSIAQLVARGGQRIILLQGQQGGESFTIYGARYQGSEYLPASISDWLADQTVLIKRACPECRQHPRGVCDLCATE